MNRRTESIVERIAADRGQGAASLATLALDAIAELADGLGRGDREDRAAIVDLADRLVEARPAMGAIRMQVWRAVSRAASRVAGGEPWAVALAAAVDAERAALVRSDQTIARITAAEIGRPGVVATCSHSRTVSAALETTRPDRVLIGDGHRLEDGIEAARQLASAGVAVELVPDNALPARISSADVAVVGADQLLANGSLVNRAGTFPLALAARRARIPLWVVCQSIKLAGAERADLEDRPDELLPDAPPGVAVHAPLFDVTPADLIHRVITEDGVLEPTDAGAQGWEAARQLEARFRDLQG